jgi:flagellar biosynthesis/type III secretory pathway protein FliH
MAWYDQTSDDAARAAKFGLVSPADASRAVAFSFGAGAPSEEHADAAGVAIEVVEEPVTPSFTQEDLDRAYREGFDEARSQLEDPVAQQLVEQQERHQQAILQILERVEQWRERHHDQVRIAVVELAGIFARQLVGSELERSPWMHVELVGQAIARAVEQDNLRLHVPPDVAIMLEGEIDTLRRMHPDHAAISILADPTLEMGDCRLIVDGGAVCADLEERTTQLIEAAKEAALQHPWFTEGEGGEEDFFGAPEAFVGEQSDVLLADEEEEEL